MRQLRLIATTVIGIFLATAVTTTQATPIFMDDFNTTGGSILNWLGGSNWTVENGSVDLVASGDFGIQCLDGTGHCVDLDGSTNSGGEILSMNLGPLGPGDYEFSYWLSGNQRNSAYDMAVALSLSITGSSGEILSMAVHLLAGGDVWQQFTQSFTLDAITDPVNLSFNGFGADNVGLMLDNVMLRQVPEPGTLALLGMGLLGMGLARRSKKV